MATTEASATAALNPDLHWQLVQGPAGERVDGLQSEFEKLKFLSDGTVMSVCDGEPIGRYLWYSDKSFTFEPVIEMPERCAGLLALTVLTRADFVSEHFSSQRVSRLAFKDSRGEVIGKFLLTFYS